LLLLVVESSLMLQKNNPSAGLTISMFSFAVPTKCFLIYIISI
jgi:hypothetical protein